MYMLPIALIFSIVFARICTTYDSRSSRGKYITIKNKTLAKLLIEKEHFLDKGKCTLQKDRNKMSIIGLIFYLCNLFIIILTLILLLLPQIPCVPFEIDATKMYLFADTINSKIPICSTMILLCSEFFYFAIMMFRYIKNVEQKWIKYLMFIVSMIITLVCGVVIIEMFFELLKW